MFTKNCFLTVFAMFLVYMCLSFVLHTMILPWDTYPGSIPEGEMQATRSIPAILIGGLIWCRMFLFVFSKGYEGKGIGEGVRFGLYIGIFYHLAYMLFYYANFQMNSWLLVVQFVGETLINISIGVVAALLFKPETK